MEELLLVNSHQDFFSWLLPSWLTLEANSLHSIVKIMAKFIKRTFIKSSNHIRILSHGIKCLLIQRYRHNRIIIIELRYFCSSWHHRMFKSTFVVIYMKRLFRMRTTSSSELCVFEWLNADWRVAGHRLNRVKRPSRPRRPSSCSSHSSSWNAASHEGLSLLVRRSS